MIPCVFLFPGQSSVRPGIVSRAAAAHPAAAALAARAREALGEPLDAPPASAGDAGGSNRDVQVTVFVATQMYLAALRAEGIDAVASIGLSLGEYSHLVDIDALEFDEALRLVDARGRCYDRAPAGVMVSILAVDRETVELVVAQAAARAKGGSIVISNYNTPTQHVIAGDAEVVAWAVARLEEEHAAHTIVIERRVPMHTPLMAPVAAEFAAPLDAAGWRMPARDYVPNVTAAALPRASRADIVSHLTRHVIEPVLWQSSVEALIARHPDAVFVEVGPGGVLHNMMGRAWRKVKRARVDAPDDLPAAAHFQTTVEALRAGA